MQTVRVNRKWAAAAGVGGDGVGKWRAIDKNLQTKRASLRERCQLFSALRERCHCCMRERQRARLLFAAGNAAAKQESGLTVLPVCGRAWEQPQRSAAQHSTAQWLLSVCVSPSNWDLVKAGVAQKKASSNKSANLSASISQNFWHSSAHTHGVWRECDGEGAAGGRAGGYLHISKHVRSSLKYPKKELTGGYTYWDLPSIMPQKHKATGGGEVGGMEVIVAAVRRGDGSGGCWSCVVCAVAETSTATSAERCMRHGKSIITKWIFTEKFTYPRGPFPVLHLPPPASPCIHINVKINPECVFLRLQRMLNKQQQRGREAVTIITGQRNSRKRIIAYGRISRTRQESGRRDRQGGRGGRQLYLMGHY